MEWASTHSAAQGVALICVPVQDTDQTNDFFLSDQYQMNSILSMHVTGASCSGEVVYVSVNED